MKTVFNYIKEALVNHKIKKREYKYRPKTTKELVECIKTELNNGNTNLNCIDTSEITNINSLFDQDDCIKLTDEQQKTLDVSDWDVSNVEDMQYMFYKCKQFNSDLSDWDVSKVKDIHGMFFQCEQFNSDLSTWDVSNVEDMGYMFYECEQFNSNLSNWNVSNVQTMLSMFDGCKQFNSNIDNWDVSKVKIMNNMFKKSGLEGKEPSWYKNKL